MRTWVSTLFTTLHCFFRAKYEILLLMLFFSLNVCGRRWAPNLTPPSWSHLPHAGFLKPALLKFYKDSPDILMAILKSYTVPLFSEIRLRVSETEPPPLFEALQIFWVSWFCQEVTFLTYLVRAGNRLNKVPGCISKGFYWLPKVNLSTLQVSGHIWVYAFLYKIWHSFGNIIKIPIISFYKENRFLLNLCKQLYFPPPK